MSNRIGERITVAVSNDDDDGVSCVTSSSRMTLGTDTETETVTHSSTDVELLRVPVLLYQLINNGDMEQLRQLFTRYFVEDCWFHSPTMDAPAHGIEHIIATVEGFIQNLPDFTISATNIRLINREVISGTVVTPRCIMFERNFMGKF